MKPSPVAAIALCLASLGARADVAGVSVTWIQPNLYVTAEGAYIRTDDCGELAIDQDAVIRYFEGNDLLTFSYGSSCKVLEVFK